MTDAGLGRLRAPQFQMTDLPAIFAVRAREFDGVCVYDVTALPSYEAAYIGGGAAAAPAVMSATHYLVTPHRFYQQDPTPSFFTHDRPSYHRLAHITLITAAADRHRGRNIIFRGSGRLTGEDVFCVYHPLPIPIVEFFGEAIAWPSVPDCRLDLLPADRSALRFWEQRWHPEHIYRALQDMTPVVARPSRKPQPQAHQQPPKFVADLVITDAVTKGSVCPITMEPIADATKATMTPCFHVFDAAALATWATTHTTCPVCKHNL